MKGTFFHNQRFLCISIVFMWIKTYAIYKLGFDLQIDSLLEELMLLINPLSFILPLFGIGLLLKENKQRVFLLIANLVLTVILISNTIFYGFYIDFITIPVLFQASNMSDMGSSVKELFNPLFIALFADLVFLLLLARKEKHPQTKAASRTIKRYYAASCGMILCTLVLAEVQQPKLLAHSFDREMLVKSIGLFQFHIYDTISQTVNISAKAFADEDSMTAIKNYTEADYSKPDQGKFGLAKGRNVIFVTLESTQSFVLNEKINGKEITPFMNDFIKKSYYFDHFYQQTEQGKTSDSEFIVANSLYPSLSGAVFFTKSDHQFHTMYKSLKQHDYYSAVFHANHKTFWNRDVMYNSFGIDRFFDVDDFHVTPGTSTSWGLKDKEFLEQSAGKLKSLPQPFYSSFITLTNHFPFEIDEKDQLIDEYDSSSDLLNRYVTTVRYEDEALKHFIKRLKDEGLYENSMIVFMGDHYGISEAHNEAMAEFLGKDEITPYDNVQLQRVPFIIHIPGITDHKPETISDAGGQVDVRPTLMHLLGIETKGDIQFGNDLLSDDRNPFAVLRNGSFITNDYVYTKNTCYSQKTGEVLEDQNACLPYKEKANEELSFSDKILNGDLLRFYE
ncbi:LTA synthase family protein [Bacillus spizizenii]|uniref:LTA synthase family protein n=1 Tax=Bacillus spizizenii TaxID=96241 RepID=UPI0022815A7C|nr:LTA synthase family protein [Bacillus spizizenii]MCY7762631.1 LTA synthase family protein [Bacillus spizizenii]MCY8064770.1 LTA synthase family protein [Bacillus spizizenii]MCY8116244.1 LTA synthase family protein [Bacillus spizizenii]MCY8136135.1 LTA synthase family protein [Bacillus spizizenii]MCY8257645.1 LTA synthase family protein [Bacillus spizizenii]